jgi:DNA-binding NarL/FixJ family response regulator
VYLVDDHPLLRRAMVRALSQRADFEVVGDAGSAEAAMLEVPKIEPDVVVVDLVLQDAHGLDLIKHLQSLVPGVALLVFSAYPESVYASRCLRAGASGYVMKVRPISTLAEAIRSAAEGALHLSPEMIDQVLGDVFGDSSLAPASRKPDGNDGEGAASEEGRAPGDAPFEERLRHLTDREMEVFQLLGEGLDLDAIAERLHVTRGAVDKYRRQAMNKLGSASIHELLRLALRWSYEEGLDR